MKNFILFIKIIFLLFTSYLSAQQFEQKYLQNNSEVYFSFTISDNKDLIKLSKVISIDDVKGENVFAYANEKEFKEFISYGYQYQILVHPGKMISPKMSSQIQSISEWNVYPTYDSYLSLMTKFASDYPEICKLVEAGNSVLGRKILFVKISDYVNQREPEPQFMFTSTIHGDETTGYVLMLRLIDSLLTSYGSDARITNLIDNVEIWINPLANPDGTYHSGDNTVYGATRYNANGYDLNRNFPDPIDGVNANQQVETTVFRNLQETNNFSLIANFHGGTEVVNYPWDRWRTTGSNAKIHPDQTWYQFISHLYADTCQLYSPTDYMNTFDDGTTNGGDWYVISGGRQDYTNYYVWGREVTIEISDTKLVPPEDLPNYWEYNKRSFLNYMESVLYGVKGIITDNSLNSLKAKVTIEGHDMDNSEVFSDSITGFYLRMLEPGAYSFIFQSDGFRDTTINNVILDSYLTELELNVLMIPDNPVGINQEKSSIENQFSLYQNYPNPFNPSTVISYSLPFNNHVSLKVFDVLGREVLTLFDEYKTAGNHKVEFNLQKYVNQQLSSGVYYYQLRAGDYLETKKMILVR